MADNQEFDVNLWSEIVRRIKKQMKELVLD